MKNTFLFPVKLTQFDLAVQTPTAALNANASTSGTLSAGMVTYYDKNLLRLASAELHYEQFADKKPIPKKTGNTIQFRYYDDLGKAMEKLTEGVTPSGQTLTQKSITATLAQYGGYVTLTDVLDLVHVDSNISAAQEKIALQAAQTRDTLVREMLMNTTSIQYADGTVTGGLTGLTKANVMNVTAIRMAERQLSRNNAPKFNGYYVAIIHPDVRFDIIGDENWRAPHEYTDTENIYTGEIGELYGVRFVETTEAKIWSTTETKTTDPIYGSIFLGKGAYAVTDIDGGIHSIVKALGSGGTSDPLDQRSTVGWKMMFACELLLAQYTVLVKTCASFDGATAN